MIFTARPIGGDPSFGQKIRTVPISRSYEEQARLRAEYESRHPRTYQEPGEERHDA